MNKTVHEVHERAKGKPWRASKVSAGMDREYSAVVASLSGSGYADDMHISGEPQHGSDNTLSTVWAAGASPNAIDVKYTFSALCRLQ
jgi:hypothetical protein